MNYLETNCDALNRRLGTNFSVVETTPTPGWWAILKAILGLSEIEELFTIFDSNRGVPVLENASWEEVSMFLCGALFALDDPHTLVSEVSNG